jgi:hypothetical protein
MILDQSGDLRFVIRHWSFAISHESNDQ